MIHYTGLDTHQNHQHSRNFEKKKRKQSCSCCVQVLDDLIDPRHLSLSPSFLPSHQRTKKTTVLPTNVNISGEIIPYHQRSFRIRNSQSLTQVRYNH